MVQLVYTDRKQDSHWQSRSKPRILN